LQKRKDKPRTTPAKEERKISSVPCAALSSETSSFFILLSFFASHPCLCTHRIWQRFSNVSREAEPFFRTSAVFLQKGQTLPVFREENGDVQPFEAHPAEVAASMVTFPLR
jgi:hypothetical protein